MPQCQFPIFCCFYVSKKLHRKYSWNWTKQKPNLLFLPKLHEDQRWERGGPGASLTTVVRPSPWLRQPMVRPPGPTSDAVLSPIKSPRREKPKWRIAFPRNILQGTAIIETRSGESRSSSRHPAGEGNPCWWPSPPPWSPLEWCVSSVPWTTGP
jgi:hypothetical protein